MKIEIDTEQLNWIEVPGKPTVGSFLQTMLNPQRDGKDAPATKLPGLYGVVLAKIETPVYDDKARDFGLVPTGTRVAYRLFQFPFVAYHGSPEFPYYGAERIVAYTKDLDRAIDRIIYALELSDVTEKLALEKPAPAASVVSQTSETP